MKIFRIIIFLLVSCLSVNLSAQELQPASGSMDLFSLFGGESQGIASVNLIADNEKSITVEIDLQGYTGMTEKYKIRGSVLNRLKKPLKEIEPIVMEVDSDGKLEFNFRFQQPTAGYHATHLESKYIMFSVFKADQLLGNLDLGVPESLLAKKFTYKFDKKWRVSGNESIVITVTLTPVGSARSISK